MAKSFDWKVDTKLPVGKGATLQRFTASDGTNSLEIDTRPWGEGDLIVDGVKQAHVEDETSEGAAFRDLEGLAENLAHTDISSSAPADPKKTKID